jgi:serine/threonine protein phosphatase PrpC
VAGAGGWQALAGGDRTGTVRLVRRSRGAVGTPDHAEQDLATAAAVSDRGQRHRRNEDAFGLAVAGGRAAAVVCDGVSTTAHPELASAAAARAALATLELGLDPATWSGPDQAGELLVEAVAAAQAAVAEVAWFHGEPGEEDPSTTIAVALVGPDQAVVGHVGDSRAYRLSPRPERCGLLTTDDSWAEEAIAAGMAEAAAHADHRAHVITRWLGADAVDTVPHLAVVSLEADDLVVLCTDGLWNEAPSALALAAAAGLGGSPHQVADRLVAQALAAGGHDNITVVVMAGPEDRPRPPSDQEG